MTIFVKRLVICGDYNDINYTVTMEHKIEDILSEVFGIYSFDAFYQDYNPLENTFYFCFPIPNFTENQGERIFTKISTFLKKYERWGLFFHFYIEDNVIGRNE